MKREAMIAAVGSGLISATIAGMMGQIYGLDTLVLTTMIVLSGIGGAWFGYRSRLSQ